MEIIFRGIRETEAEIIISYKHGNEYACFDSEKHQTDIDSLLTDSKVDVFIAINEEEVILGFVEVTFDEEGIMEMSGALLPEFKGVGFGCDFITECIDFVIEHYDYNESSIKTLIPPIEKHAVHVLERVGFQTISVTDEWIELQIEL